jgi:FAD-dependent urate hydroxylase
VGNTAVAIIGAGPYGLSLAAHLASKNIDHRIFGRPMQFWSQIARAGDERYLKSYCFGTNLSSPKPGHSFADHNTPRGLETFEPCSMANFAAYGQWFQQNNVPHVEAVDVARVTGQCGAFGLTLANGERLTAAHVVIATGLARFATVPQVFGNLSADLVTHTSNINSFASFKGKTVAVIGAGQSALEAAALLHEAGAQPTLLVREDRIRWHARISPHGRSLWQRLRSPISGLGSGPKAWALTHFPGIVHRMPERWRTRFVKRHLPAEGAWWLRSRLENRVPINLLTTVVAARGAAGQVELRLRDGNSGAERDLNVDHVIAGSGYDINVDHLDFLEPKLRGDIQTIERSPRLTAKFESSVNGLYFVGPMSAMSFGPLFRFVVGAGYTAKTVSAHLATQAARQTARASLRVELAPAT